MIEFGTPEFEAWVQRFKVAVDSRKDEILRQLNSRPGAIADVSVEFGEVVCGLRITMESGDVLLVPIVLNAERALN